MSTASLSGDRDMFPEAEDCSGRMEQATYLLQVILPPSCVGTAVASMERFVNKCTRTVVRLTQLNEACWQQF